MDKEAIHLLLEVDLWPSLTGVYVYDPLGGHEIINWSISEIYSRPAAFQKIQSALDPFLPLEQRLSQIAKNMQEQEGETIKEILGIKKGQKIKILFDYTRQKQQSLFLKSFGFQPSDWQLSHLENHFIPKLQSMPEEKIKMLCQGWWNTFEYPGSNLRLEKDSVSLPIWQESFQEPIETFSLWTVLLGSAQRHLFFKDMPLSEWQAIKELQAIFV